MLADTDGTLDEMVEVVWVLGRQTLGLEDTQNLVSSDPFDLSNSVPIS